MSLYVLDALNLLVPARSESNLKSEIFELLLWIDILSTYNIDLW